MVSCLSIRLRYRSHSAPRSKITFATTAPTSNQRTDLPRAMVVIVIHLVVKLKLSPPGVRRYVLLRRRLPAGLSHPPELPPHSGGPITSSSSACSPCTLRTFSRSITYACGRGRRCLALLRAASASPAAFIRNPAIPTRELAPLSVHVKRAAKGVKVTVSVRRG